MRGWWTTRRRKVVFTFETRFYKAVVRLLLRIAQHFRSSFSPGWRTLGQMLKMWHKMRPDRADDYDVIYFFKGLRSNAAKEFRAHPLQAYSIRYTNRPPPIFRRNTVANMHYNARLIHIVGQPSMLILHFESSSRGGHPTLFERSFPRNFSSSRNIIRDVSKKFIPSAFRG